MLKKSYFELDICSISLYLKSTISLHTRTANLASSMMDLVSTTVSHFGHAFTTTFKLTKAFDKKITTAHLEVAKAT